jgi:simple sugar transport system substrate-binding protein
MKSWKLGAVGAAAAALLVLAGCGTGGQGGGSSQQDNAPAASQTRDLSYAVVIHGDPDGSFWNVVKRGAEDAAKQYGVKVEVTGNVEGSEQAKLIDSAVAKNPTGLVVSMANPDALQSALAAAKSKNIPFVTINSGLDKSAAFGAIAHVGQTETVAGRGAGQQLKQAGGTNIGLPHSRGRQHRTGATV